MGKNKSLKMKRTPCPIYRVIGTWPPVGPRLAFPPAKGDKSIQPLFALLYKPWTQEARPSPACSARHPKVKNGSSTWYSPLSSGKLNSIRELDQTLFFWFKLRKKKESLEFHNLLRKLQQGNIMLHPFHKPCTS